MTRSELAKKRDKKLSKKTKNLKLSQTFPTTPPDTSMKFDRDWRRHCSSVENKLKYLKLCTVEICGSIWSTEIDVNLLGAIISTLAWSLEQEESLGREEVSTLRPLYSVRY